jgi:opacity protein-like surface antigen
MMLGSLLPATIALFLGVGQAHAADENTAPAQDESQVAASEDDSAAKQKRAGKNRSAAARKPAANAQRPSAAPRAPVASANRRSAPASAASRRPPGHAAPAYRPPAAAHHAPAVAHHRAVVSHHRAASAHAAWVAHRQPAPRGWFAPWRPGYRAHWYHGVFVYGPRPMVVAGGGGGAPEAPKREITHAGKFSLGIRGGSYISGYDGGASYGDAGLGLAARYRIVDPLGLEVQWMYHDQSWDEGSERIQQPISVSAEVFAFPWSRVNPYVLAGVSATGRNVSDELSYGKEETDKMLWGPHLGLGLEVNLTKQVSVNLDGRYLGYVNAGDEGLSAPNAFQGNLGMNFYF